MGLSSASKVNNGVEKEILCELFEERNAGGNVEGNGGGNQEDGLRGFEVGVCSSERKKQKKGSPNKIKDLASCCVRSQYQKNLLKGLDYSKPIIVAMPAPDSVKEVLSRFGWNIIVPEDASNHPIYVSPTGSVYLSMVKALEAVSLQAKERCSSQQVGSLGMLKTLEAASVQASEGKEKEMDSSEQVGTLGMLKTSEAALLQASEGKRKERGSSQQVCSLGMLKTLEAASAASIQASEGKEKERGSSQQVDSLGMLKTLEPVSLQASKSKEKERSSSQQVGKLSVLKTLEAVSLQGCESKEKETGSTLQLSSFSLLKTLEPVSLQASESNENERVSSQQQQVGNLEMLKTLEVTSLQASDSKEKERGSSQRVGSLGRLKTLDPVSLQASEGKEKERDSSQQVGSLSILKTLEAVSQQVSDSEEKEMSSSQQEGSLSTSVRDISLNENIDTGLSRAVIVKDTQEEASCGSVTDLNFGRTDIGVLNEVEKGEGLWEIEIGEVDEVEAQSIQQKKEKRNKRKIIPEGDPNWSPGQGSSASKRSSSRCRNRSRNRKFLLEGLHCSKPLIQAIPAPRSINEHFALFGWKITMPEGSSSPVYISPYGSRYESLLKALETFSFHAPKCREKQVVSIQPEASSRKCVVNVSRKEVVCGLSCASASKIRGISSEVNVGTATRNKPCVSEVRLISHYKEEALNIQKKKETSNKRKGFPEADPDWSPPQGSSVERTGESASRRGTSCSQIQENPSEISYYSKPILQANTPTRSIKDVLLAFGWKVSTLDGASNPIYVSPTGFACRSLLKALKAFSGESSQTSEEVRDSSQLVDISSNFIDSVAVKEKVVQKTLSSQPIDQIVPSLSAELGTREAHQMAAYCTEEEQRRGTTNGECQTGGTEHTHFCNLNTCMHSVSLSGDSPQEQLTTDNVIVSEAARGQVKEVAVDEGKELNIKDEHLNREKNSSVCCNVLEAQDGQKSDDEIQNYRDFQGVRRSTRINGRHVAVDMELDLELFDGDYNNGRHVAVDMAKVLFGKTEFYERESDKETSRWPEKMRFRDVREVLASCMVEDKLKSGNSIEKLMPDISPLKHELYEENAEESLLCDEEMVDTDNDEEASSVPVQKEMMDKESLEVETSSMTNDEGDECLSNGTEESDRSPSTKSDQDKDSDMLEAGILHGAGARRSTRISGKRVPIDEDDIDLGACILDDDIYLADFIVKRLAKKDKQRTISSLNGNVESKSPTEGNTSLKQISRDLQKPRKPKVLKTNNIPSEKCNKSENYDGINTPDSKKCSPSIQKNGEKSLLTKKQYPSSAGKRKSVGSGESSNGKKKKKKKTGGCGLLVRRTGKVEQNIRCVTKVNVLSWLIDSGVLVENEKVVYKVKVGEGRALEGSITRRGIRCNCCRKILSLLDFESHAGSDLHQPWNNITVISGMSLMECQHAAWEKEKKQNKIGFQMIEAADRDPSDDTCGICADGGELICCDGCPSTFHQDCLKLKSLPEGNWYCSFCTCVFCMLADRGQEKCSETMDMHSCNQCGWKYHTSCVWEMQSRASHCELLAYCGKDCEKVASGLSEMIGVSNSIGRGFSWSLLRRDEEEGVDPDQRTPLIIECNVKLSLALLVLHECFVPLMDPRTGLDMISQAVYSCGSNFNRLNYGGFYTLTLEKDEEIISVATLRLHGTRVAEMPFIGTRPRYRRRGMCRRLLNAIEEMLLSLNVDKLIIPAIPDMLETWTKSFSFKHLEPSHKEEIRKLNMMIFADTTLLQKPICNKGTDMQMVTSLVI